MSLQKLRRDLGLTEQQKKDLAVSVLPITNRGIILVSEFQPGQDVIWKVPGGRGQMDPETGKPETPKKAGIRELNEETRLNEYGIHISESDLRLWHRGEPYSGYLRNHPSPHWKKLFVVGGMIYLPDDYIEAIETGKARGKEDGEWISVFSVPEVLSMQNILDLHREAFRPLLERANAELPVNRAR
ncbi:MAG: NUDIX domain-containing protein [Candidatus Spechtbacterales bacterium]|nr:NUDIX domain-containing protein [Candidatus Spechtbacterales bacterium]